MYRTLPLPQPSHGIKTIHHLPFHLHLEVANPNEVLEFSQPLDAELIIVCRDTLANPSETLAHIHAKGAKTGLSLNPDDP